MVTGKIFKGILFQITVGIFRRLYFGITEGPTTIWHNMALASTQFFFFSKVTAPTVCTATMKVSCL